MAKLHLHFKAQINSDGTWQNWGVWVSFGKFPATPNGILGNQWKSGLKLKFVAEIILI